MIKKIKMLLAGMMIFPAVAFAQIVPAPTNGRSNSYNGYLANESGLTSTKTYTIDLAAYVGSKVSANVLYSTVTFSTAGFISGQQSTGSIRVITNTALSSAAATDQITIVSTQNISGSTIRLGNCLLSTGIDWSIGTTKAQAATNLAAAIAGKCSNLSAGTGGASGAVVYATATYGSYANAWSVTSSTNAFTVATAQFTGGADNAVITINGLTLTQGTDWNKGNVSSNTAANIATAINARTALVLTSTNNAAGQGAFVYSTSTLVGTAYNYTLVSSTPTALSVSQAVMTNGLNQGFALNSVVFTATQTATSFVTGLPVLLSTGGAKNIPGGLVNQTTYYIVAIGANQFNLVKYATSAIAGTPASDYVTITSTFSQIVYDTFTLTALPIAGNPTFVWQASNDNSNWATVPLTSTTTAISLTGGAANGVFDFGFYNYRYLRLNVGAPSAGAIRIQAPINIKQDGIGPF